MSKFFKKHWEVLSYLIFGVLTTLLNIVLYALFNKLFGYTTITLEKTLTHKPHKVCAL